MQNLRIAPPLIWLVVGAVVGTAFQAAFVVTPELLAQPAAPSSADAGKDSADGQNQILLPSIPGVVSVWLKGQSGNDLHFEPASNFAEMRKSSLCSGQIIHHEEGWLVVRSAGSARDIWIPKSEIRLIAKEGIDSSLPRVKKK